MRERTRIDEVVGQQVTLKPAGSGSLKGLCPFHDERSPSFTVRPAVGLYHCFGCGEGGDVYSFVQKVDGVSFVEAVERLAGTLGHPLRYEDGGPSRPREDVGRRARLLDAHRVAAAFYVEALASPEAEVGRRFLVERGFDRSAAERFGVGFAPAGWDALTRHLRAKAFTDDEIVTSGLGSIGQSSSRGPYDRFRGRLVWPIRDTTGAVIGFGARRLLESDQGPKYLNTPETPLYRKSHVLYGLDLAKRSIARERRVVVVEGYTDVMACHLAGVETAVATCGTAFGDDHASVVRRFIVDDGERGGEVVFTFDGDAAGQKAALRAFESDQRFSAQTSIAVEPDGMDPCELRIARGDAAVRSLVEERRPLFEFAIRSRLVPHDLDRAEGRVAALRSAAPLVAAIKDRSLRPEYSRQLAGWLGMDVEEVRRAVSAAGRGGQGKAGGRPAGDARGGAARPPAPVSDDPVVNAERQVLQLYLQAPSLIPSDLDHVSGEAFTRPEHRALHDVLGSLGGAVAGAAAGRSWLETVMETAGDDLRPLVHALAVAALPEDDEQRLKGLVASLTRTFIARADLRRESELRSRAQRLDAAGDADGAAALWGELSALAIARQARRTE